MVLKVSIHKNNGQYGQKQLKKTVKNGQKRSTAVEKVKMVNKNRQNCQKRSKMVKSG